MLPPTTITAPTSADARPKPASSTVSSRNRPSRSSVSVDRHAGERRERSCSAYSSHIPSSTCRASAATMGVMRTAWATTIAAGVKSSPRWPSGPERERRR